MYKYLKLVGLSSYAGRAVRGSVINKGQTCKFAADVADQLLEGANRNADGDPLPYWREVEEATVKEYQDFTDIKIERIGQSARTVVVGQKKAAEDKDEEEDDDATAVRTTARKRPGQRAAAAQA